MQYIITENMCVHIYTYIKYSNVKHLYRISNRSSNVIEREYVAIIRCCRQLTQDKPSSFFTRRIPRARSRRALRDGRLGRYTYTGHNIRRTKDRNCPVYYVPRVRRHAFQPSVTAPNNVPECQPKRFLVSVVISIINRSQTLAQTFYFFPLPFLFVLNLIYFPIKSDCSRNDIC